MLAIYWDEDEAYEAALRSRPVYVYNDFGGGNADYKKIHRGGCRTLDVDPRRKKTSYPKICGEDLEQLLRWLRSNRGPEGSGYTWCAVCAPTAG